MMPGIEWIQGSAGASGATAVGGRDRFRDGVDEGRIERTGFGQMIEGLTFVEAGHFDGKFDRRTWPSISSDPSLILRDRNDAMVDLRRELAVDPDLFVAGGFPLRQRRIIEERETDGALDLQRAGRLREKPTPRGYRCDGHAGCVAGSVRNAKTRSCMSDSAGVEVVMRRSISGFEDRGTQDLSGPQLFQDVVGLGKRKRRRLGPDSRPAGQFSGNPARPGASDWPPTPVAALPRGDRRESSEYRSCEFLRIPPCRPCARRAAPPAPVLRRVRR